MKLRIAGLSLLAAAGMLLSTGPAQAATAHPAIGRDVIWTGQPRLTIIPGKTSGDGKIVAIPRIQVAIAVRTDARPIGFSYSEWITLYKWGTLRPAIYFGCGAAWDLPCRWHKTTADIPHVGDGVTWTMTARCEPGRYYTEWVLTRPSDWTAFYPHDRTILDSPKYFG